MKHGGSRFKGKCNKSLRKKGSWLNPHKQKNDERTSESSKRGEGTSTHKENPSRRVFSVTTVRNGVICPRTAGIKKATKVLQRRKMSKEQTLHVKFQMIMKAWCLWL